MKTRLWVFTVLLCLLAAFSAAGAPGRLERELSGDNWRLWLDHSAKWIDDDIHLPPVDIASLPVNPPSCGWDNLGSGAKTIAVPATVEEYFWSANDNPWGEAGDYRGVSWFSTSFAVDPALKGKRITLAFDSVVLRAEVFVNRTLAGYDVIGSTPFEVDITGAVRFGEENTLDVRITDPVGNFDWSNNDMYRWGANWVPAYHGFGGITGKVYLRATDGVRVDDISVRNTPKVTLAEVTVALKNRTGAPRKGKLAVVVHEWKNPSAILWEKTVPVTVPSEGGVVSLTVNAPSAKPWNIRDPHLYTASVQFTSGDGAISDSLERRFGFRWFEIGKKDGDERFYLNGKRVFVFGPMQRGYWPKNGMFPTPEMARRNVELLLKMGFNTFIMNQCMVQPTATDICDEYGILTHADPGGYRCDDKPDEKAAVWRTEKLRRMVLRDRSKPSWFITLLKEETNAEPSADDIRNMRMVHALDPTRLVIYNSDRNRNKALADTYGPDPFKLHMRPMDDSLHDYGWFNHHHFIPTGGWIDDYYRNPRFFLRGQVAPGDSVHEYDKGELTWLGEEGAFGAMIRLEKIKEELDRTGATGWQEALRVDFFKAYDRFLDESGFRSAFPTVDNLTLALGENLHYYHGRNLENARISNVVDAYNLNAWAADAMTHTDLVDQYRNPTADPSILARYAQPLYVAVKVRTTVLPSGEASVADFFIVNELDLNGAGVLEIELIDPDGQTVFTKARPVRITGGEEFGQLLAEGVQLPAMGKPGYYTVNAAVKMNGQVKADGFDRLFVVDYAAGPGLRGNGAVIDTSGVVNDFLKRSRGTAFSEYDPAANPDFIVIGRQDRKNAALRSYREIMENVANGTTLIVLDQADRWAQRMDDQALRYINNLNWGSEGRLFVGKSKYLNGLPQAQSMNWEYQAFYGGNPWAVNLDFLGTDLIVGFASQGRKEIGSALTRIAYGNGQIFLSTLDILPELASDRPQSAVAKKLFLNLLETK